jgi:hypothetical protein
MKLSFDVPAATSRRYVGATTPARSTHSVTAVPPFHLIILPRRDKKRGPAVTSTMIPHNVISAPAALTTYPDETSDVKTTSIVAWNSATTRMLPRLSL